jgi:glutathione synthase/RimK-type ligase-like ATP-grasp enzyme
MAKRHLIGLLLATEDDWPSAFEAVIRRLGDVRHRGESHELTTERITNEPFDLRYTPRYDLVIDRLSWWYDLPREWLKKVALMDDVYLLNNPFTFQAMEKHAAYCAMMRLGIKVPDTWLIPHKLPPDNPRYVPMAERYNPDFDLEAVAERVGYPLFMKPFDGGMWVGVTRITSPEELREAYESSGERLMHIQASMEDFDVFTRSLSIGPQTLVAQYDPSADGHYRYSAETDFLSADLHHEVETISRLVNAFFRWEFNSCEVIVKGNEAAPIDYANASPDIALVSLHFHFPWAIRALVAWCAFCAISERPMRINQSTADYFAIADGDLGYDEKLEAYRSLSDRYFQIEEFEDFCGEALPNLDEVVVEYVESPEFDELAVRTITTEVLEPEKHEALIERSRANIGRWAADQRALT